MSKLIARNIGKVFTTRGENLVVLRDVSLEVDAGESVVIMGPSGSGKSTVLNILGTLEQPSSGEVVIDGCDPFALDAAELATFRNRRIGFIFQEHHLLPQCSVIENVMIPTLAERGGHVDETETRARELLERVGLSSRLEHRPAELSGGERQRVAIARALIHQPAVVLADEPTGNLDQRAAGVIATLLSEMHRAENAVLVVVTHSDRLAGEFGRRFDLVDGVLQSRVVS